MGKNEKRVKLTERMRRAGADALAEYDDRYESAEDAAVRVFLAMVNASEALRSDVKQRP